jgi:hypothetical protein
MANRRLCELTLGALAETLAAHWTAVGREIRIGVVVVDQEPPLAATLAPHRGAKLEEGTGEDVDLLFLTNSRTLEDIVRGRFDPTAPDAEHLFRYGGDTEALRTIARALAPSGSWLDVRVAYSIPTKNR